MSSMFAVILGVIVQNILKFYYPFFIEKRLKKLRYTPRTSPDGRKMKLLSEEEEDVYLDEGMQAEEDAFSVDYDVWIDEDYEGLLYRNEIFQEIRERQRIAGYIKNIREDGKIDVSLQSIGFLNKIEGNEAVVLEKLKATEDGFFALNDKSSPEDIKYLLKMSKKSFKSAIGGLYKAKIIVIASNGIYLSKEI